MAAVTTKPTICRLTIFVDTFSYTSKYKRFQNATDRCARHSHCPKALCGSRGHIHLHDFYWKRNSLKNEILGFSEHVNGLSVRQFCRMSRLSKEAFQQLVTVLSEHRQHAGRRLGRHAVDAKLSMTPRWLAGWSYLDIALAHCVSISPFFRVVDEKICDLDDIINWNLDTKMRTI
jgi:hypothetical protein